MTIQELVAIGAKTTMRIGGQARFFVELLTKEDVEAAWKFAQEKSLPLIVLGGGSNTIFADGIIEALVVRIKADAVSTEGNRVTVSAGKILASLLNELAEKNLDLSPLTGIPGTVGGALFGNAGQGPKGIWLDSFVESVTLYDGKEWKTLSREECDFRYRESTFKDMTSTNSPFSILHSPFPPILWSAVLTVPTKSGTEVKAEIERLIKKRIETQPHIKTAGSCFKALPDGTPAWKLIEAAGLRGLKVGGVQVSEKHANFLLNVERGTFTDTLEITRRIQEAVPQIAGVEMRFYDQKGQIAQ
ncbi:MAG: UDP-N-acetylmuramate dehydrogenase [Candidatus Peregrinibacteria bacterium]|nr:UDP-N-acetylmuramate dehydrogenase [Candidatus Peregrinibacteria bacterium]